MPRAYRVEPFDAKRDRTSFSWGVPELDRYIQTGVGQDVRRLLAAAFLLIDAVTGAIVGYYTLSAAAIEPDALPDEVTRRLPRYATFPAALIGRLAVDRRYQGQGAGAAMLADALSRVIEADVRAMAIVVDAIDDQAASFYRHHGFVPFAEQPRRLYLMLTTARRARKQ